jgi:hypothetical protein
MPIFVSHQHGFNHLSVFQSQQKFPGTPVGAVNLVLHLQSVEGIVLSFTDKRIHPAPERRRKRVCGCAAIQDFPQSTRVNSRKAVGMEEIFQLLEGEIVKGGVHE